MIYIIHTLATQQQIDEMMQALETYIKLAVDIERGILAGGGSSQDDVWGADWNPTAQQVTFESLINIRPRQANPSMEILDPQIRDRVAHIVRHLLERT
jgi:hypothetical protein